MFCLLFLQFFTFFSQNFDWSVCLIFRFRDTFSTESNPLKLYLGDFPHWVSYIFFPVCSVNLVLKIKSLSLSSLSTLFFIFGSKSTAICLTDFIALTHDLHYRWHILSIFIHWFLLSLYISMFLFLFMPNNLLLSVRHHRCDFGCILNMFYSENVPELHSWACTQLFFWYYFLLWSMAELYYFAHFWSIAFGTTLS